MPRFVMSRDEYARRYVIGMYTPRVPLHLQLARRRSNAVKKGRCIECVTNECDGDYTHCRPCLDRKKTYNRRSRKRMSAGGSKVRP